jgi:lipopolysaccharide export system permease protein
MLFDTTLRRELSRAFGAALVVILTIVLTMVVVRTLDLAGSDAVAPQDMVLLLGFITLGQMPIMLALSLFVAVVATLGRMYRDSEMPVWFASGVGMSSFVRPVLRTAWPVLLVIALLMLFVWPWVNRMSNELRESYVQRSDLSRVTPGVFLSSRDGRRVFFIEHGAELDGDQPVEARNVFVLTQRGDREAVTTASRGRLESEGTQRVLVLEQGQHSETAADSGERTQAAFDEYRMVISERLSSHAEERSPRTFSTLELLRDPQPRRQGELAWRFGLMLAAGNLTLLAIGLAAINPRRASSLNLVLALLAFVVYYNLVTLTKAWVGAERVGLGSALAALHGCMFLAALALLWWRDHAAVLRLPWRRRAA